MDGVRRPAVAGTFYPDDPKELAAKVAALLDHPCQPERALAVVAPHAGYVYSGGVAGEVYARVVVPKTAIVLCPNHTGMGVPRSIWPSGAWEIPGGELRVDAELVDQLVETCGLEPDTAAHRREHAIEVQLPFLRARNAAVSIVPICLSGLSPLECVALGEGIAQAIRDRADDVLLVASTDMSHYVDAEEAREFDGRAMARVSTLDPEGLYRTVQREEISMCGFIPTTVVLAAARALGARHARLVRYSNSGEVNGEFDRVVGYAGFVVPGA